MREDGVFGHYRSYLKSEGLQCKEIKFFQRESESEAVQLSNFYIIEGRETGNIELSLIKMKQFDSTKPFREETWLYEIGVEG